MPDQTPATPATSAPAAAPKAATPGPSTAPGPAANVPIVLPTQAAPPDAAGATPAPATGLSTEPVAPKTGERAAKRLAELRAQNQRRQQNEDARLNAERAAQREQHERIVAQNRAAQAEAESARFRGELDAVRGDPFAFLDKAGLTPKQVAERAVLEADPEYQLKKEVAELRKERDERKKAEDEAKRAAEAKREADEISANYHRQQAAFMLEAKDTAKYPTIAAIVEKRPRALIAEVKDLVNEIFANADSQGKPRPIIPNHELLAYIEKEWSKAGLIPATGSTAGSNGNGSPSSQATSGSGNAAAGTEIPGSGTTTLGNSDASRVASLPVELHKLSAREEKAALAAEYKRLATRPRTG